MDPYGLRRPGLGLIQVFLDEAFSGISLRKSIGTAAALYASRGVSLKKDSKAICDELDRFLSQRMETYLKRRFGPESGYRADLADAVLCGAFDRPLDLYLRFVALISFQSQPDFEPLMISFKRASRILPPGFKAEVRAEAFKEPVEKALYESFQKAETEAHQFFSRRQYGDVLKTLAGLRRPIDAFFNGVMVMDEDPTVRENRLALLSGITNLFSRFGDFTRVLVEEGSKGK
jgi:glycyl-tRNA synthetase beta chain